MSVEQEIASVRQQAGLIVEAMAIGGIQATHEQFMKLSQHEQRNRLANVWIHASAILDHLNGERSK